MMDVWAKIYMQIEEELYYPLYEKFGYENDDDIIDFETMTEMELENINKIL